VKNYVSYLIWPQGYVSAAENILVRVYPWANYPTSWQMWNVGLYWETAQRQNLVQNSTIHSPTVLYFVKYPNLKLSLYFVKYPNLKLSLCLITFHVIKICGRKWNYSSTIMTWPLDESELAASRPGNCPPPSPAVISRMDAGWGLKPGTNTVEYRKICYTCREPNSRRPVRGQSLYRTIPQWEINQT
jgi:hypothetical protein